MISEDKMDPTKQPKLQLVGEDGNAFFIMARAIEVNRRAKYYTDPEMDEIMTEAKSGDYDNLLGTFIKYFDVS
jgi:hypothetical protein